MLKHLQQQIADGLRASIGKPKAEPTPQDFHAALIRIADELEKLRATLIVVGSK
jgi:hypothetical protein